MPCNILSVRVLLVTALSRKFINLGHMPGNRDVA